MKSGDGARKRTERERRNFVKSAKDARRISRSAKKNPGSRCSRCKHSLKA